MALVHGDAEARAGLRDLLQRDMEVLLPQDGEIIDLAQTRRSSTLATVQIHKTVPVRLFEFDTTVLGNSNRGHLYGTDLTNEEKELLIEFLKTL